MKVPVTAFIAIRYLLGRAHEGGRYLKGAAAGIALSLIPIIVTLIVADGMIQGITDRYLELGTGHLQVYDYMRLGLAKARAVIAQTEGVRSVWQERHGLGVVIGKNGKTGATLRAVDPAFFTDPGSNLYLITVAGSTHFENTREVLLGEALAQSIGAQIGDTIRIMTIRVSLDGRNIPRMTPFKLRGIISSGYRELDALWCLMSLQDGEEVLPAELSTTYLTVKIDEPYTSSTVLSHRLSAALGAGYDVYTWEKLQHSQYSSYQSTRQLLLFIMALIVIVAAVNVSAATSMLAIERTRDIAILKASGTKPAQVERIFLCAALVTGITGALIGISSGLFIGIFINEFIHTLEAVLSFFSHLFKGDTVTILDPGIYLETIPIIIDWETVWLIALFTVICSVFASWIPAHRAGKLSPIAILRKY
jgi:lipoprotein-releasing system permease protein